MKVPALFVLVSYSAFAQKTNTAQPPGCVVTFTLVTQDTLKNVKQGLLPQRCRVGE
jgi:hypothetical protein